jgi:TonB family protein
MPALGDEIGTGLLALSTNLGLLYARPSKWERVYLRWIFRHFDTLPEQVLTWPQRRLVRRLCRAAMTTAIGRVPRTDLLGTIENLDLSSEIGPERIAALELINPPPSRSQYAAEVTELSATEKFLVVACHPECGWTGKAKAASTVQAKWKSYEETRANRKALRGLVGVVVVLVMVGIAPQLFRSATPVYKDLMHSASQYQMPDWAHVRTPSHALVKKDPPPTAQEEVSKPMFTPDSVPRLQAPEQTVTYGDQDNGDDDQESDSTTTGVVATAGYTEPQIVTPPQAGFDRPISPSPDLTGTVNLAAAVDARGTVTKVIVLSGNLALAEAAVHAVRRWHYSPSRLNGGTMNTHIIISFSEHGTVSIASVTQ